MKFKLLLFINEFICFVVSLFRLSGTDLDFPGSDRKSVAITSGQDVSVLIQTNQGAGHGHCGDYLCVANTREIWWNARITCQHR